MIPAVSYGADDFFSANENESPPMNLDNLIPNDDDFGPVGIVNELYQAHSDLSGIMERQSMGDHSTPDYPFVMTYVDEEKEDLVVMMHSMAAIAGIEYEEEELQIAIGHDIPIEIMYGEFILEVSQSRILSWSQYYIDHCIPVQSGYQAVCTLYAGFLRDNGVDPDSLGSSTPSVPNPPPSTSSPCTVSSGSVVCYYYTRYQDRCIPTHTTSRCNTYATQITSSGYTVPTQPQTPAPAPAPAPEPQEPHPTNVVAVLDGGTITVTWGAPDYDIRKYKIYTYENNRSIDRSYTTTESFSLSPVNEGSDYKFRVKAYYTENIDGVGSKSNYVFSNTVSVPITTPVDNTPPVITVPDTITVDSSDSNGIRVNFEVNAIDAVDGTVSASCHPPSGSLFEIGTTLVTCNSSDSSGNSSSTGFYVVVMLTGSLTPITEFYGGDPYYLIVADLDGIEFREPSTVTIGATNSSGVAGIVVAGHGLIIPSGHTFVEHTIGLFETKITSDLVIYYNGAGVDAAFIPITEPNIIVGSKVKADDGTVIDVTQGVLSDVERGEILTIYGSITDGARSGSLLFKDAAINFARNHHTNMGLSTYVSEAGDSGAPIIYHHNGESELVGVHEGTVCIFESISENQPRINVNNTRAFCDYDNESYYYKAFSAWENVKSTLNLR